MIHHKRWYVTELIVGGNTNFLIDLTLFKNSNGLGGSVFLLLFDK